MHTKKSDLGTNKYILDAIANKDSVSARYLHKTGKQSAAASRSQLEDNLVCVYHKLKPNFINTKPETVRVTLPLRPQTERGKRLINHMPITVGIPSKQQHTTAVHRLTPITVGILRDRNW
jgi:hypothetical protein